MDQVVNKKIKSNLKAEFDKFYVDLVLAHIRAGNGVDTFKCDDRWSVLKHRHAGWCVPAYVMVTARDIRKSFSICGIDISLGDEAYHSEDNHNNRNHNDRNR